MAPYRLGVGTTGVIFAAIAIAWLAYLVPHFVRRREDDRVPAGFRSGGSLFRLDAHRPSWHSSAS